VINARDSLGARRFVQRKLVRVAQSLRGVIAVAAAYALVLQTLIFAFGWCPYAALQGPGFICSASAAGSASPVQSPQPSDGPCCSLICCDAVVLGPPNLSSVLTAPAFWIHAAPPLVLAAQAAAGRHRLQSPLGPRGPPPVQYV
jgi:hypothetical protein